MKDRSKIVEREFYLANKTPPHSNDAETNLLASILVDPSDAWPYIADWPTDRFYKEAHRLIFTAMKTVAQRHGIDRIDVTTVTQVLTDAEQLDAVGGLAYLMGLGDHLPTAANAATYAAIVEEKHTLRRVISASVQVIASAYEQQDALEDILDGAARITSIAQVGRATYLASDDVDDDALATIERWSRGGNTDVMKTGLYDLDEHIIGLERGALIVLGARPAMGKTAAALTIAAHVARTNGPVMFASLEMPARQLAMRQLANAAKVSLEAIRGGRLTGPDFERLSLARERRRGLPLGYVDRPTLSVADVAREARARHARTPLSLVVIDYLQLLIQPGDKDNETAAVSAISRQLKQLAMELNAPVLALSQLSRDVEKRPNKRPVLSDLRQSGAIEQDADVVMFIYRDEYYNPGSADVGVAEFIIGKQRNGPIGTARVGYDGEAVRFYNLARQEGLYGAAD